MHIYDIIEMLKKRHFEKGMGIVEMDTCLIKKQNIF